MDKDLKEYEEEETQYEDESMDPILFTQEDGQVCLVVSNEMYKSLNADSAVDIDMDSLAVLPNEMGVDSSGGGYSQEWAVSQSQVPQEATYSRAGAPTESSNTMSVLKQILNSQPPVLPEIKRSRGRPRSILKTAMGDISKKPYGPRNKKSVGTCTADSYIKKANTVGRVGMHDSDLNFRQGKPIKITYVPGSEENIVQQQRQQHPGKTESESSDSYINRPQRSSHIHEDSYFMDPRPDADADEEDEDDDVSITEVNHLIQPSSKPLQQFQQHVKRGRGRPRKYPPKPVPPVIQKKRPYYDMDLLDMEFQQPESPENGFPTLKKRGRKKKTELNEDSITKQEMAENSDPRFVDNNCVKVTGMTGASTSEAVTEGEEGTMTTKLLYEQLSKNIIGKQGNMITTENKGENSVGCMDSAGEDVCLTEVDDSGLHSAAAAVIAAGEGGDSQMGTGDSAGECPTLIGGLSADPSTRKRRRYVHYRRGGFGPLSKLNSADILNGYDQELLFSDASTDVKEIQRRAEHNMIERKRRDRINFFIFELLKILPSHYRTSVGKSKGAILKAVYEHYKCQCDTYRLLKDKYKLLASVNKDKDEQIKNLMVHNEELSNNLVFISQTVSNTLMHKPDPSKSRMSSTGSQSMVTSTPMPSAHNAHFQSPNMSSTQSPIMSTVKSELFN